MPAPKEFKRVVVDLNEDPDADNETTPGPLSPIEHDLELEELDSDIFRSKRPLWRPAAARAIFGGSILSQCLASCARTVPEGYIIHSLHSYFVLPGDETRPIVYHVERVRDGKSYCTRTVQARQRNKCILTMTCSFQRHEESSLTHQVTMPQVPEPDALLAPKDMLARSKRMIVDPVLRAKIEAEAAVSPIESRMVLFQQKDKKPDERHVALWVKAKGQISGDFHAHAAAIAYFSDSWFLSTALRVNNKTPQHASMMASLDHSIYFHKQARADEWLLYDMNSTWSGRGRGLAHGRIFTKDGDLIAECVQEGLIRMKL
ncbi:acyl-CoA thioesterase family protein [Protomyces lactucae-debilis]|uniref:Acyl-CoA thioesterase family protein n=1 Tax=Protomyces lactucae-debilis TaxID=2754530 RepID=A0A1Y2FH67_PROLT|nr:acyl-CoA thioesterase family protein [Protomyces lactucae-debilis]ORY83301.1 acyl-CoA thioesterase family protein [Protomyces lactucae-debilis]